jgi:tetratricopeptide (TPR) repeat protein
MRTLSFITLLVFVLSASPMSFAGAGNAETIDRDLAILQKIVKQRPDAELYYRLGDLYVQKGRQTGDITYFSLAGNSLRASLNLAPNSAPSHRHLAFVLYSLHDFAGAMAEADRAIKLDPDDSYAYGVRGDAQLETGEYDQAFKTYEQMVALKGDLYSYSRRSGLETIRGDDAAAVADLQRAIASGIQTGEPPEGIAWSQVTLAQDYFLMGKLDDASKYGEAALKTYPNYHRALAIMGQILAAQNKLGDAAEMYQHAIAIIPLPEYAAALGDVYAKMGRERDAQQDRQLVEFIARLNALNQVLYSRVLVDFYADHDIHHQQAVEMAAAEFKIRHDIYGHDALAWALYRDGKAGEALPHIVEAIRFETSDARLYFHAGLIYAAVGQNGKARGYLKQALVINPHFQPILDEVAARKYAVLGGITTHEYAQGNPNARR